MLLYKINNFKLLTSFDKTGVSTFIHYGFSGDHLINSLSGPVIKHTNSNWGMGLTIYSKYLYLMFVYTNIFLNTFSSNDKMHNVNERFIQMIKIFEIYNFRIRSNKIIFILLSLTR